MWPFSFKPVYASVDLNVSELPYSSKLMLFVKHEQVSPFSGLPYTLDASDLPDRIPSNNLCSLPIDVMFNLLDKKEKLTFWSLKMYLAGYNHIDTQDWSAYVVVNSTSPRECNKIIEAFLNEEVALDVYVNGQRYEHSYFTDTARAVVTVGSFDLNEDHKVIRSEN